jgi:P pilus assembly chaperone PapD
MKRIIVTLLLAAIPGLLMADAFSIVPVRVELGKTKTSSLTITNDTTARTFEVRAVTWSQDNGVDTYKPTDELLVVPSTFHLDENASQVIRVSLNRATDAKEHAYRVFINEVVPAPQLAAGSVVATVLSVGIPAFVLPENGRAPQGKLELTSTRTSAGVRIEAHNAGVANLKAEELTVSQGDNPLLQVTPGDYLLAGTSRTWDYPLRNAAAGPVEVSVRTDRGTFKANSR